MDCIGTPSLGDASVCIYTENLAQFVDSVVLHISVMESFSVLSSSLTSWEARV
jgi:hypothetical protein